MKYVLLLIIKLYQITFSFDHGIAGKLFPNIRVCIYHPSCSAYGYESIKRYGTFIGGFLTIKRVLSCGPWSKGGNDHVKDLKLGKFGQFITKL